MAAPQPFVTIGSRVAVDEIGKARKDAKRLGITLSQWLRIAVIRAGDNPITKDEAQALLAKPSANGKAKATSGSRTA